MSQTDNSLKNVDAERRILGCLIENNAESIEESIQMLGDTPDAFYLPQHQSLYRCVVDMYRDGDNVDFCSIQSNLDHRNWTQRVGGVGYLAEICGFQTACMPRSFEYYANFVKLAWYKRRMIAACSLAAKSALSVDVDVKDLANTLAAEIYAIMDERQPSKVRPLGQIIPEIISEIEEKRGKETEVTGIPTGILRLDNLISGMRPETLNILAARPSVGKSAIACNIAHSAAQSSHPVLFFSLEMREASLAKRFLTINTRTSYKTLGGTVDIGQQKTKLGIAGRSLSKAKINIDDSGNLDVNRFRSRCRRFCAQHFPQMPLIVIDYLQLCEFSATKAKNRYEQVGDFTREAKLLANELRCPILLLCQLSREAEGAEDPFKVMHCLRESGNIEQDADTILIALKQNSAAVIESASAYGFREMGHEVILNFAVVKNRDGAVGACPLLFTRDTQEVIGIMDGDYMARPKHPDTDDQGEFIENTYSEADNHEAF